MGEKVNLFQHGWKSVFVVLLIGGCSESLQPTFDNYVIACVEKNLGDHLI